MRVGIGYDIHALKGGRKLILGGVHIPSKKGLAGHSDGDALFHAVVDAALGAAGLGDIGGHFSDKDPRWKGASGAVFARGAVALLRKRKLRVAQIDSVLILEKPNLSNYKEAMRGALADAFGLDASDVNVKAKTNEGFGPIGKGQAIAAQAVVVLERS
jgi:2-C-methyl-D-erythritol 2,4-cyclodiphosphate synthase